MIRGRSMTTAPRNFSATGRRSHGSSPDGIAPRKCCSTAPRIRMRCHIPTSPAHCRSRRSRNNTSEENKSGRRCSSPLNSLGAAVRDHVVPPHMRQTRRLRQRRLVEAPYPPLDPAEPGKPSLLAGACKYLHADADTENRNEFPQNHVVKRLAHAGAVEQLHGMIERTDAGHDELACALEVLRTCRNRNRNVQPPVEVCESPDISQPVIDDGDHRKIRLSSPSRLNMFAPRVMRNMLFR